jgi:hypothetical protein
MTALPTPKQEKLLREVHLRLADIGYKGELWQESYSFQDWFEREPSTRTAAAVAFGQTPFAYDTACFAVLFSEGQGEGGPALIRNCRSLGAPRAFEIKSDRVVHWRVSVSPSTEDEQQVIRPQELEKVFREYENAWKPTEVLRAKVSVR